MKEYILVFIALVMLIILSYYMGYDNGSKKVVTAAVIKRDTVLVYFTDTVPKNKTYSQIYPNFTETRYVTFYLYKDYKQPAYRVVWYLWIDGDIAEDNLMSQDEVMPDDVLKYKARVMRMENKRIPELLKVWAK